jgi:hypothetical protein
MTSLYTDPIKIHDDNHNVTTSDFDPMVSNIVGYVGTSEKPTYESMSPVNPRSAKTIGQKNVVDNSVADVNESPLENVVTNHVSKTIDISIVESLKETITLSNVAPDVTTSLAQTDAHVETIRDNSHLESESESASDSKNSQHKMVTDEGEEQEVSDNEGEKIAYGDDKSSGSESEDDNVVSSDESDKEKADESMCEEEENAGGSSIEESKDNESASVDKDQYADILNAEDLDSNDEPIGRRLNPSIAKRLKKRKEKAIVTESQP